ncbi:S2-RNase [Pyrus ussuriensis x Pyrus communis]|uniref:S2-RNase n=1 Tax=Pyrus ussuriensis x Pyrus communis TaxID=2448454 RepID=A0A5N5I8M8_9ROSA|nr:S2-RNase [Pyrus ussuriensis x Pyrus communis]
MKKLREAQAHTRLGNLAVDSYNWSREMWAYTHMESGSDREEDEVVEAELDLNVHTEKHWFLDSNRTPDHWTYPSHFFTVPEVWDR